MENNRQRPHGAGEAVHIQRPEGQSDRAVRRVEKEDGAEKAPEEEGRTRQALNAPGSRLCRGDQHAGHVRGRALVKGSSTWQREQAGGRVGSVRTLASSVGSSEARSGCS